MMMMMNCFTFDINHVEAEHQLTSLKASPQVFLMYPRKAAVHCRVVTLSVLDSQNGTSMFSSLQYRLILFLRGSKDVTRVISRNSQTLPTWSLNPEGLALP